MIQRSMASAAEPEPPDVDKMLAALEGESQETWLQNIATLVKAGEIDAAESLLRAFRARFPDKR